ncbi:MAG TPA: GAF domain-containing protein [Anaerolineales bacterium]|nr:GAF domain-containing protein [Anaerolineales bacterium]
MKKTSNSSIDLNAVNERLGQAFYASRRYNPLLIAVTGLGFIAIYLLTQQGILGEPAPQLLYLGMLTVLFAISEFPILALAQQKKGIAANFYSTAIGGLFTVFVTLLWKGSWIIVITILIATITPVMAIRTGMPRKYWTALLSLFGAALLGIIFANQYANANFPDGRLHISNSAAIASIVFAIAATLLLITIVVISRNRRFKSLQSLLLTSFAIIVTIPTVMAAVLSAIAAYAYNQTQVFNTLEAITTLKMNQVETLMETFQGDAKKLLDDATFSTYAQSFLSSDNNLDSMVTRSFKQVARSRAEEVLGKQDEKYTEIMILDTQGIVVMSTTLSREGSNYQKQPFFEKGLLRFYTGFGDELFFGTDNLFIAAPIFDSNRENMRGVLVLRSNAAAIKEIMENTPGFSEAETYLVNNNFRPVTGTRAFVIARIDTQAAREALGQNITGAKAIYENYTGHDVLGYYRSFPPMELAVIAEVPLSFVISSSINSLAGTALLALFVVAIAITAVVISARTIADPITTLVHTTESFATGKLSARALVDREDEIGRLAQAYNQMAVQLQEIIGSLEHRVADRTQDLENQTMRLRVAAEIARDAASARQLRELLAQAAQLIYHRFGFYHTGIFLLDNDQEYAVLVASPTEAGRKMIENNHKLRVGETGIVGRVAATGEARITMNTGMDAAYFNNPLLPNTKSEMALPLRVENRVTGVLDVQSDQPNAFTDDDVAIIQILADQLATAIERTRLLQEVEVNLKELETAYGQFTSENWKRLSAGSSASNKGYRFDNVRVEPVTQLTELADAALKTGILTTSNGKTPNPNKEHEAAIPIKLRGQTIGVITLKLKDDYAASTISTIELAAERLAAAMESARLYEETRLRADREQSISRITSAISMSTEYEEILQTTVREIGSILRDTEVAIQILEEPTAGKRAE